MKVDVTHHKGKGAQYEILPGRAALNKVVRGPKTLVSYAKAGPTIARNGPTVTGLKKK